MNNEFNPFTKVVAIPDHGEHSCRVEWIVNQDSDAIDITCADFLIRRSPDQGYTNIKLVSGSISAAKEGTFAWVDNTRQYFFIDEDTYKGNRESTWYYQVILRQKGKAYYSAWVSAKGKNPLGHSAKVEDPNADKDSEDCDLINLNSPGLVIDDDNATRNQQDEFVTKQQLGITRQIMNLERIHNQRAGTRIALLKPLLEGTVCSHCRDIDTGQVRNSLCSICYGTGMVGGYDEPVCTYATDITSRHEALQPNPQGLGQDDPTRYVFRYVSEPEIFQHDVLVQIHDDLRFVVEKVEKYLFKGKQPLISHITTSLVQRDDIIYKIPALCVDRFDPIPPQPTPQPTPPPSNDND